MNAQERQDDQTQLIESINTHTYVGTIIRIANQIMLIDAIELTDIQEKLSARNIGPSFVQSLIRSGVMDVWVVTAIHKDQINEGIRKHFELNDRYPDPSQFSDRHQMLLQAHPHLHQDIPPIETQLTFNLVQTLFPEFSVTIQDEIDKQPTPVA